MSSRCTHSLLGWANINLCATTMPLKSREAQDHARKTYPSITLEMFMISNQTDLPLCIRPAEHVFPKHKLTETCSFTILFLQIITEKYITFVNWDMYKIDNNHNHYKQQLYKIIYKVITIRIVSYMWLWSQIFLKIISCQFNMVVLEASFFYLHFCFTCIYFQGSSWSFKELWHPIDRCSELTLFGYADLRSYSIKDSFLHSWYLSLYKNCSILSTLNSTDASKDFQYIIKPNYVILFLSGSTSTLFWNSHICFIFIILISGKSFITEWM